MSEKWSVFYDPGLMFLQRLHVSVALSVEAIISNLKKAN